MSHESLASPTALRERISMPHIEPLVELLEKELGSFEKPINPETIRSLLNTIMEEMVSKAMLFESKESGTAFPYTTINTADIAKRLYKEFSGYEAPVSESNETVKTKKEFFFGSFLNTQGGSIFMFFEEILHKIIKDLPTMIGQLKKGENPDVHEVCVLGSPTNVVGKMSPEFSEKVDKDAFRAFGDLYAEFIATQLPQEKSENPPHVAFHGISMGASFATETAEILLDKNLLTQAQDMPLEALPFLQVRLDTPPGPNKKSGGLKLYIGFILDALYTYVTDSFIRKVAISPDADSFLTQVNEALAQKGMPAEMSPEQEKMKKEVIRTVFSHLKKGVPLPAGLKVTEIIGTKDLLTYSSEFNREAAEQKEKAGGSLGENLVSKEEGRRTFAADMRHSIPYLRHNELVRIKNAADTLDNLRS